MSELTHRYDFVYIFDVQDGNPNGDPDAGNLPRMDPETGKGLVTDVCLKRKIRNFVQLTQNGKEGYDIFIKEKGILNNEIEQSYAKLGIDLNAAPKDEANGKKRDGKGKGQNGEVDAARQQMCRDYYDVRTFGAVMSTGANAGQVRGPVQLTFARSADPITPLEFSITRMAVATQEEADKQSGGNRTFGRKTNVPYGVYVAHGFISPALAAQTGFSEEDLELLWQALGNMFEQDRSAARGLMSARELIVFKHDSALGNAPAHKLFDRVQITLKDKTKAPREFADYAVSIDENNLPQGIQIERKL